MLTEVYSEFTRRLGSFGTTVIGGGAVRDHLMGRKAKDYDLFLLNHSFTKEARSNVMNCLSGLEVVKPLEFHQSEPYLVVTVRWCGVDVQVMLNPATSPEELISTFDWNVCLFAYDGSKFITREHIDNIGMGKTLYLNKVTFPQSTLRRGFRFSERFGMQLPRATVIHLCEQVLGKKGLAGPAGAEPDMPSLAANILVDGG